MAIAELVLRYVHELRWVLLAIVIVLPFHQRIAALIDGIQLQKVKAPGVEVEFRALTQAQADLETVSGQPISQIVAPATIEPTSKVGTPKITVETKHLAIKAGRVLDELPELLRFATAGRADNAAHEKMRQARTRMVDAVRLTLETFGYEGDNTRFTPEAGEFLAATTGISGWAELADAWAAVDRTWMNALYPYVGLQDSYGILIEHWLKTEYLFEERLRVLLKAVEARYA